MLCSVRVAVTRDLDVSLRWHREGLPTDMDFFTTGCARHGRVRALQPHAAATYPGPLSGGISDHQRERFDVASYSGSRRDQTVFPQSDASNDRCVGADGTALFDERLNQPVISVFVSLLGMRHACRSGVAIVRERSVGPHEYIIFDRHSIPNADVVLDGDVISNSRARFHERVTAQITIVADRNVGHDVCERPNSCSASDLCAFDERLRVIKMIGH